MRRGRRPRQEDELANAPANTLDPELDYLKARCQREFREAFVAALGTLTPEERNVLRLHHLDGLTLEETAAACHIGRATAARWLARARERIVTETHRLLQAELRLSGGEVESVLRLVESQLELSIHRYLGEAAR
jgi:RNA polymerase sigma-70 factor (ECF subfamily)